MTQQVVDVVVVKRLRAKFGTDVQHNALHGASTAADALELIQAIPDLEIEERPPTPIEEEGEAPPAGARYNFRFHKQCVCTVQVVIVQSYFVVLFR